MRQRRRGNVFRKKAKEGAERSCLGSYNFKYHKETAFITGYIEDSGDPNYFVGHRRWLLSSQAKQFSYGATDVTDAVYCFPENKADTLSTAFIAYPWNGYVPHHLIFPKWSFSIPSIHKADFKNLKISITDKEGKSIPFTLLKRNDNFPDHTIVWKMPTLFSAEEEKKHQNNLEKKGFIGKEITVKIDGLTVDNKAVYYQYKVKICKI